MDNLTMIQYFEWYLPEDKTLWRRCTAQAKRLARFGLNMVWLPPAYKGANGVRDVGYAVYDTYDLGEFDQKGSVETKYGSKKEYLTAIKSLQDAGISVLGDVVLNHRIGADGLENTQATETDFNNRFESTSAEHPVSVWTRFDFEGRHNAYSDFKWNWSHFSGTDWDEATKRQVILQFHGKDWDKNVDSEHGNYDFLMGADLDMSNPEVDAELNRWGKWYLDTTGVDGFRLDAVKHIDSSFYAKWLSDMRAYRGKDFFTVGEYWTPETDKLLAYLDHTGHCMSLFDAPLHFHFHDASCADGNYDLGSLFSNTLAERDGYHAVTFVDNHDTQPGQALQSPVASWFKPLAYGLILLNEKGVPCVFYGDLYGMPHENMPPVARLPRLIFLRKIAAYGYQHDYFDDQNVVGFTREGDTEHPDSGLAMLISDKAGGEKVMYVGRQFSGQRFYDCTEHCWESVEIDADGCGTFRVLGGSISVWVTLPVYERVQIET